MGEPESPEAPLVDALEEIAAVTVHAPRVPRDVAYSALVAYRKRKGLIDPETDDQAEAEWDFELGDTFILRDGELRRVLEVDNKAGVIVVTECVNVIDPGRKAGLGIAWARRNAQHLARG